MILSRLTDLYDRLSADPEFRDILPLRGRSVQKVSFEVVLDLDGNLIDILDAKITKTLPPMKKGGKTKEIQVSRDVVVLGLSHPSGTAATPRLLWDTSAYMFGFYPNKAKKEEKDMRKAMDVLFPSYRDYHLRFRQENQIRNSGFDAVCKFLEKWNPAEMTDEIKGKLEKYADNFGVFRILGENEYVFNNPEIEAAWDKTLGTDSDSIYGMALDSGEEKVELARLIEPKIKIGSAVGGAALVSFQCDSFRSYGKSQSYNSPISKEGAFKACNALNFLLNWPGHHIKIGETMVVFWTGVKTTTENLFAWLLEGNAPEEENEVMDAELSKKLSIFWEKVKLVGNVSESPNEDEENQTPFFILGIEPNAARVVIRFWHESTVGDIIEKLKTHHQSLQIERRFQGDPEHLSLWQILKETVRDSKDIPPLLSGTMLRSVIEGLNYPTSLFQMVLNRVNVTHADKDGRYQIGAKVTYPQAAIIKAFLIRNHKHGEIKMSLNTENKSPAYLLGRLFATLEKTQSDASGGVNAGVGDKFYSSASSTPKIVFPTLLDLFRKHLKKLEADNKGRAIFLENLVMEILDSIDSVEGFPANLTLEERGMFALGYYQQMRVFFTRREKNDASVDEA